MVYRFQGVSGTLESHPTFAKSIHFNQATSFGVKNKIKDLLKKKETVILTSVEKNNYQDISALIDIGAHERGKNNQQVAMELAQHFRGSSIQYVLFFKEDQLAAWKVSGTDADIIMLPSTDATVIEKYLSVKPEERFTYYPQTNATGTDILQAREARARVTVDVATTMSDFLQAVMRMRQLFAGQTIEIVISRALKEKLGPAPTLDNLYDCLEQFEHDKLADDVFKSACKQLFDVVQNDFDQRLLDMDAKTSIRLFPVFQSLLVGENLMVLPSHYGKEKTLEIFLQIKKNVLEAWNKAMHYPGVYILDSRYETHTSIEKQCDHIIQQAMIFCREYQQTSLSVGTEVSIEQQQETQVQVKLKVEQQIDPRAELLKARHPDLGLANILSVDAHGNLTGNDAMRNRLGFIWNNSPWAAKMDWSDRLWLSSDFYMIHDRQMINTLPNGMSQKPVFATLFWKSADTDAVHGLIVSQEEAEVLAKRLTAGLLNSPSCQIWLETTGCHIPLAGVRPANLVENVSYQILKEQISVLNGDVVLLAEKKEWFWFKSDHIPILQQQMMKQDKQEDSTLLVALAKKISGNVIKQQEETAEHVLVEDFLPKPPSPKQPESTFQSEQTHKPEPQASSEMLDIARQSVEEQHHINFAALTREVAETFTKDDANKALKKIEKKSEKPSIIQKEQEHKALCLHEKVEQELKSEKIYRPSEREQQFIQELTGYIDDRIAQAIEDKSRFHTFFGWVAGMSSSLKICSATKMISAIQNPHKKIEFTHDELIALSNNNLGNKVSDFIDVHPVQYCQSVKENSYNLSKRYW
jgi:hypothetical protein